MNYHQRDKLLRTLGYPSYRDYLHSTLWVSIRQRAIELHGTQCTLCPAEYNILHHVTYNRSVLLGNTLEALQYIRPLCNECHTRVELDELGVKRTLTQAQRAFHILYRRSRGR